MAEIGSEWTAHNRAMLTSVDPQDCFPAQVSARVRREPGAPGSWRSASANRA